MTKAYNILIRHPGESRDPFVRAMINSSEPGLAIDPGFRRDDGCKKSAMNRKL